MEKACSQNQEERSAFKILTGKPTGKRALGRPRCRREDDVRIYLKEILTNDMIWVNLGVIEEPLRMQH